MRILITGATGNVGAEVIRHFDRAAGHQLIAGVRGEERNPLLDGLETRPFDFYDLATARRALEGVETVFLLRPPQIADVANVFAPLIRTMREAGVRHVVFLSVQGVEQSSVIPHHKIEKLLRASGLAWTFMRPSYFMQNLTTTLRPELVERHRIYLPAAEAPFLWVDVADIGRATAVVLANPTAHRHQAYDITGTELLNFRQVATMITEVTGVRVEYRRAAPLAFLWHQWRSGQPLAMAFVVLVLHYLPRFSALPQVSPAFTELTGRPPAPLRAFIERAVKPLLPKT